MSLPLSPSKLLKNEDFKASLPLHAQVLFLKSKNDRISAKPNPSKSFNEINVLQPHISQSSSSSKSSNFPIYILEKNSIEDIKHEIQLSSQSTQNYFVGNGSDKWGPRDNPMTVYKFECTRSRVSKSLPQEKGNLVKYDSTNNSRKKDNRAHGNKQLCRRTTISRPTSHEQKCPCRFRIFQNEHCFFLQIESEIFHKNHPKLLSNSNKVVLSLEQKLSRETMSMATAKSSSVSIGMQQKFGINITRQKVYNDRLKDNNGFDRLISTCNDAERLKIILHKHNCKVLVLRSRNENGCTKQITAETIKSSTQRTQSSEEVFTSSSNSTFGGCTSDDTTNAVDTNNLSSCTSTSISSSSPSTTSSQTNSSMPPTSSSSHHHCSNEIDIDASKDDIESINKWIQTVKTTDASTNMICVAWMTPDQLQLARAFPLNLNIDSTHSTCCIANLHHLTITSKGSNGSTYVILRMWIPNEQLWMFKYVLHTVIPSFLGKEYCQNVRAIISDGDPQLIKIIHSAIFSVFIKATWIPCTWHLVDRSMITMEPSFHTYKKISKYWKAWFCRFIQNWVYTFMIPSEHEDELICSWEEYSISKSILLGFVNSDSLKKFFLPSGIDSINDYLISKVFTNEHNYLWYKRMNLFNWELHSNSGHEGTNLAIKRNADPVSKSDSLGTATNKISNYDSMRMIERRKEMSNEYLKQKTYTIQWKSLIKRCVGVLEKEKKFSSEMISEYCCSDKTNEISFFVMKKFTKGCDKPFQRKVDDKLKCTLKNPKNPTKKELSKMKTSSLYAFMNDDEKEMVDTPVHPQSNMGNKPLSKPGFVHVRKVSISLSKDPSMLSPTSERMYINCDCGFDNRFGAICRHKLHIYDKYLESIGVRPWCYKDINVMHWTSYAYLSMKSEKDMTHDERSFFKRIKEQRFEQYFGTPITFKEGFEKSTIQCMSSEICEIARMKDKDITDVDSPYEWRKKSPMERLLYFDVEIAKLFVKKYNTLNINASKFEVELSQGGDFDFEVDGVDNGEIDDGIFEIDERQIEQSLALSQTMSDRPQTVEQKKCYLLKQFYEAIGVTDLNDDEQFQNFEFKLCELTRMNVKKRSSQMTSVSTNVQNQSSSMFPGPTYGNMGYQSIAKRDKRLRNK